MKQFVSAIALIGAAIAGAPVTAQGGSDEAAARFGARSDVLGVSLSPSGTKVAFVMAGPEHTELVRVVDLAGDAQFRTILTNGEKIGDIDTCDWATDDRLVCQLSGMAVADAGVLVPFDRLLAINADGSNVKLLSQRESSRALGFAQTGGDVIALNFGGGYRNPLGQYQDRAWDRSRRYRNWQDTNARTAR